VFFFNYTTQTSVYGTLKNGAFSQRGSRSFTHVTDVVAFCDPLLVYNRNGGGALAFPMTGGTVIGNGTPYHLSAHWGKITATDTAFFSSTDHSEHGGRWSPDSSLRPDRPTASPTPTLLGLSAATGNCPETAI
jgi:hypothetical protein